jgi:hypothetical protein
VGVTGTNLPKIGAPATRAFAHVGITTLEDLCEWTERDLLALHGVGPRAITILRPVMAEHGVTFRSGDPAT